MRNLKLYFITLTDIFFLLLFSDVLSLGSSQHWKSAMKIMTKGKTDKMDAKPIVEYFEPLIVWLKEQNKGETIGWKSEDPMICP